MAASRVLSTSQISKQIAQNVIRCKLMGFFYSVVANRLWNFHGRLDSTSFKIATRRMFISGYFIFQIKVFSYQTY